MMEQDLKSIESLGKSKGRRLRRLCTILDNKGKKYNVEDLMKLSREEIDEQITQEIDHPYQRFDS